jgi:hypothetical protein
MQTLTSLGGRTPDERLRREMALWRSPKNRVKAARALSIPYRSVLYKLKDTGLVPLASQPR